MSETAVCMKKRLVEVAAGREPAELVLKNAVYVNVFTNELCTGDIAVVDGVIAGIGEYSGRTELDMSDKIVCPGFIESHIHLESALVSPKEFVRATLPHGTTTVITDPHEIANVMGLDGIEYMLQATAKLPQDVYFMLPSCVPATPHDESGAVLGSTEIAPLYENPRVLGLAEMMDFTGVVAGNEDILRKIADAQVHCRRIDGHAPGLSGKALNAYVASGIGSDHECSDLSEALEKLRRGQYIMIREGTAAHNLEALAPLLRRGCADRCLFCSDDKHPSDLLEKGHIDYIIKKAVSLGADAIAAVKAASFSAAQYFRLCDRGAVAPGYIADLAVIDSLESFKVTQVYKRGEPVFDGTVRDFSAPAVDARLSEKAHSTFNVSPLTEQAFSARGDLGIIGLVAGEIVSNDCGRADHIDIENDILKIAVIERHKNSGHIGVGYIKGYGLKQGAVATSISHDSHNIIVVGTSECEMAAAANLVVERRGGIIVTKDERLYAELVLPVAGIMSDDTLISVNRDLEAAKRRAFELGVSPDIDPFMTLSFMSLPVIPVLRLTTGGVFNVVTQKYV